MNKYVTKAFAKKMLLTGALLWFMTFIASFVILWNVYGLAGSSLDAATVANGNGLASWSIFSKVTLYIQYVSYAILILGILNLIVSSRRKHP